MKILIIALLFMFQFAFAGINSVGGGGGLGEIEFLFYFKNTKKVLNYCLQTVTSHCALSNQWSPLASDATRLEDREIQFTTVGKQPWQRMGSRLLINTKFLYDGDTGPKSEAQILSFAMTVQLASLDSNLNFEKTWSETTSSLKGISVNKKSTPIHMGSADILFHRITFQFEDSSLIFLAIEDQKKTVPLNELIEAQFKGLELDSLQFGEVTSALRDDWAQFSGVLAGRLNGLNFDSRYFRLSLSLLPTRGEIDPASVQFQLSVE